jgi:hypothetical protein
MAYIADVDADGFTGWADFGGGLEDVEAAAAAEVDDFFALGYVSFNILILGSLVGIVRGNSEGVEVWGRIQGGDGRSLGKRLKETAGK